jgi:hypothetical protein
MFNLNYDPQRQGYDAGLWKTLTGTPSVSSNALLFNADSAIQYADCFRGTYNFKLTFAAAPVNGYLTGGTSATSVIATWNAVEDGEFTITIDGVAYDIIGLDFSEAADMDEVAALIQVAIRAETGNTETVVWSTNKFIITGRTQVSVTSAVSDGTGTDISGAGATAFLDAETGRGTATAGANKEFGLTSLNKGTKALFNVYGNSLRCVVKNDAGVETLLELPWVATWSSAAALFQIKWNAQGVGFYVNGKNVANINNSVTSTMSAYINNPNADNLLLSYFEGTGIESYL